MVRSVGKWSAGLDDTESSIFNAYVDMIRGARHYIYIENQFFITRSDNSQREVINFVGHELVERIVKAYQWVYGWFFSTFEMYNCNIGSYSLLHIICLVTLCNYFPKPFPSRNGENFRVYVLLPLLPAFEGMIGKSSGIAMQYIVYWNYVSISR